MHTAVSAPPPFLRIKWNDDTRKSVLEREREVDEDRDGDAEDVENKYVATLHIGLFSMRCRAVFKIV